MMSDADLRAAAERLGTPEFATTPFVVPPAIERARVAIVTTAGLHRPGAPILRSGDPSFVVVEAGEELHMGHASPNFDRTGWLADPNVVFPVDRLAELADDGRIGSVASRHLAFLGNQPDETLATIGLDSGPAAAALLRNDGVDVALLTPVCPACTRTGSVLAHALEANGIATIQIASIRFFAERIRPPRALYCEFPLGRPLGKPGDAAFQLRVIEAAFKLLQRRSGPVLEDFPETIADSSAEALQCALPPRADTGVPAAVAEARGLRAAYERQLAGSGRTNVGHVTDADGVPAAVAALVRIAEGTPLADAGLPGRPRQVGVDVRAYYEEAAVALSGHVPEARQAEAWFFQSTDAGEVMRRAQVTLKAAGVPFDDWYYLVPTTQQTPDVRD